MNIKKLGLLILSLSSVMMVGCGETPASSSTTSAKASSSAPASSVAASSQKESSIVIVEYKVTFDLNYDGSTPIEIQVKENGTVTAPNDPSRTGYLFSGWFTASEGGEAADLTKAIVADTTFYAHWEQVSADDVVSVVFEYNYDNAGTYYTATQKKRRRVTVPTTDPEREGYRFAGWYKDAACTEAMNFTDTISENLTLYAKWLKEEVFEAEYTLLDGKAGLGYSGNCSDIEMVQKDRYGGGASNGYYISWLYYNGAFLEWQINSDVDVSNVWLTARLSVEFFDMYLTQDTYQTYVNGELQTAQYNLNLDNAVAAGTNDIRPFEDYVLNTQVTLHAGQNSIKLVTNNDDYYTGTMSASSPLVDCIKLASNDATFTWAEGYPITENLRLFN